jgi:oleate hydratase
MNRNFEIKGRVTAADLPKINPLKLNEIKKQILVYANSIPPYYPLYTGRDQSVPEKEAILIPKFPSDSDVQ